MHTMEYDMGIRGGTMFSLHYVATKENKASDVRWQYIGCVTKRGFILILCLLWDVPRFCNLSVIGYIYLLD